jgi:hypothetical protein
MEAPSAERSSLRRLPKGILSAETIRILRHVFDPERLKVVPAGNRKLKGRRAGSLRTSR